MVYNCPSFSRFLYSMITGGQDIFDCHGPYMTLKPIFFYIYFGQYVYDIVHQMHDFPQSSLKCPLCQNLEGCHTEVSTQQPFIKIVYKADTEILQYIKLCAAEIYICLCLELWGLCCHLSCEMAASSCS